MGNGSLLSLASKANQAIDGDGVSINDPCDTRSLTALNELAALFDSLEEKKRLQREARTNLRVMVSMHRTNAEERVELLKGMRNLASTRLATTEIMVDHLKLRLLDDSQYEFINFGINSFKFSTVALSDLSTAMTLSVEGLSGKNKVPNDYYSDLLQPLETPDGDAAHASFDRNLLIRVYSRSVPPVGGIDVKEHFEINVAPLEVRLTSRLTGALQSFFFPAEDAEKFLVEQEPTYKSISALNAWSSYDTDIMALEMDIADLKKRARNFGKLAETAETLQHKELAVRQFNHVYESLLLLEKRILVGQQINIVAKKEAAKDFGHKFEYVAGAMSSKEEEPTPQIKRSSTFRKSKHTKEPTADHSPLQTRMSAYGGSPMSLADHLALDDSTENVQRQSYSQPSSPNASPSLKSHRSLRLRLRSMSFKKPHSPTAEQRTKSTAEEVLPTPTANDTTHTAVRTAARSLSMALSNSNSDSERSVGVDSPRRNRSMATFKRPILNSLSAKPVSPTTESKSEGADPDSKRQNPENGEKNGRSGDDMDTISAEDTPHSNTTDVELEQDAVEPEASEATHTVNTTAEKSADNDIDIEFNPLVKRSSENSNDETTSQGPRNHRKNTLSVITLSPSILRKTSGAEPGPPPRPPLPSSIIASMSQASLDHNSTTTSLGTNGSIVFGTSNEDRTGPEKTIVGAPPVRPPPPSEAALKGTASGVDTKLSIDTILSLPETTSSAVKRRSRKSSKSDKKNKDGKKESKIHRRQRSNTMSVVGNQNATDKANSMYLSAGLEKDGAIKEESATRNSTDTPSFARRRHKRSKSAYYERPDIALLTNCNDHGTTEQSASTVEYSLKKSRSQGKPPNLRIGDITGPMRCPTVHSKLPQMDATTYAQLLQPPQSLLTLSSLSAMRSVQRDSTIVSTESWISHKSSNSAQAFRSPSFKHDTNDRGSIAHPLVDAELQHKRSTPATPNNPFEEVILRNLQAKHAPVNAQAQPSPLTHTQSQSNSLIHTPPTMQMSTLQHPPSLPAYSFSYPHASLPQSDTHAHTGATTHAHTHAHAHTWSGDQSTVGPSGSANSISAPVPGYTNSASDRRLLSRARSDASYAEGVNAPRLQPTPTDTCLSLQSLKACDTEEASVGFQIGAGSSSLHSVSSAVPSLVNGPAQEPELYTNKNMGLNLSQSLRSAALPVVVSTEDAVEGPGGMLHHPGFTADMSSTMSQSIKSQSTMDDQHSVQYSMASFDPSGTPHETADSGGRDTSQKTSSSGSKGKSKAKKIDDVDLMKARANSNMSFVYMKIPKVGVRLSYRAGDGDILFNLNDFFLSLPTLEYHDRTWAWKDLLEQIKKDCVAHVLSQVVRQKMGGNKKKSIVSHNNSSAATVDFNEGLYPLDINESGDPAATGLRFQDISKAKMLLGRSVSKRVKHTKALMKEARRNIAHNIDEVIEEVAEHIKLGPKDTPQASDDDTVQLPSVDYPLDSTMPQPHLRKSQSFLTSVRNKYRVPSTTNVSGNGADPISDEAQDRAAQVTSPHGSGSARGSAANSARGSAVNKAYNGHVQTMGTTMTQPHTTRRSSTPQTLTKVLTTITPATARVGTTGSPKIGSRSPTALVSPTIPSDAAAVALQRAYSVNTRRAPGDEGYRIVDPRENTPQLPVQTRSPGQAQQATTQMKAYRRPPPTPPVPYAKSRSDECVVESGESVGKHTDVGAKPGLR